MPLPYPRKKIRYRYKKISPGKRQRLAFVNNKVVEVTGYRKKNHKWVEKYNRKKPKK